MSSSKPRLSTTGSSLTATFSTARSRLLALAALSLALAGCAVAPSTSTLPLAVWSQHGPAGQLAVRAIVAEGLPCPLASVENQARSMRVRAGGNGKTAADNDKNPAFEPPFAVTSCEIDVPATTAQVEVSGQTVALPKATVQRIVLLGDTGCRIKISANGQGDPLQDCSSADAWPWARIARAAAREKPDLVIHVGDYYYREYCDDPLRCTPLRERGVVVSYGWVGWQADFLSRRPLCWRRRRGSSFVAIMKIAIVAARAGCAFCHRRPIWRAPISARKLRHARCSAITSPPMPGSSISMPASA
jgi:hypothetical protein